MIDDSEYLTRFMTQPLGRMYLNALHSSAIILVEDTIGWLPR
jgi:hypothetical protein